MTERLYFDQAYATGRTTTFEAAGARLSALEGKPSLVLPRTLFYPEGGGQLGDAGTIVIDALTIVVRDTQVDGAGTIHHLLTEAPSAALTERFARDTFEPCTVRGAIDAERRTDQTLHHTAQHALSRALAEEAEATTVSARLGAVTCTIDVAKPSLTDADVHRAEDLVNAVVMSNVVVRAFFPSEEELAGLELRKKPNMEKAAAGVRVVAIENFDMTPCGGTHCAATGEIGQIRIIATEKYKGMCRVTFVAGKRALLDGRARHQALSLAAAELTCGPLDVTSGIQKLRADLKASRAQGEGMRTEAVDLVAAALRPTSNEVSPRLVAICRPQDDLVFSRALAARLARDPGVLALCGAIDGDTGELLVVLQRAEGVAFDCGAHARSASQAKQGRGGGRPERAEARFPKGTPFEALEKDAKTALSKEFL